MSSWCPARLGRVSQRLKYGARFMGVDKEIGSIDVGKAADLVLVKGNPATNIKDIENVAIVFKDGVGYDPAKLVEAAEGTVGLR